MRKNLALELSPENRCRFFRRLLTTSPYDESDYGEEVCVDILTDMRHFARIENLDFDAICRMSEHHFEAEAEELSNDQ